MPVELIPLLGRDETPVCRQAGKTQKRSLLSLFVVKVIGLAEFTWCSAKRSDLKRIINGSFFVEQSACHENIV